MRVKIYCGFFVSGLLFIAVFYAVVDSPIFQVKEFKIINNGQLTGEAVMANLQPFVLNNRLKIFLGVKNLLVWNKKIFNVSNATIAEVRIERHWFKRSVDISVKEKERFVIWCGAAGNCYWIDRKAVPFEAAPQTEGSLILTVQDASQTETVLGKKVINDRFAANLVAVLDSVTKLKLPIKTATYDGKLQELRIEAYRGPSLLFSPRFDPFSNLAALRSLEEKVGLQGIEYIDLRTENRLYYKNF